MVFGNNFLKTSVNAIRKANGEKEYDALEFLNIIKKKAKDLISNDKKSVVTVLFLIITFSYFYPVIKHSKNKLDCEVVAKNYIVKNKKTIGINKREIKMLSTNFCYGGEEIYEIENLQN